MKQIILAVMLTVAAGTASAAPWKLTVTKAHHSNEYIGKYSDLEVCRTTGYDKLIKPWTDPFAIMDLKIDHRNTKTWSVSNFDWKHFKNKYVGQVTCTKE